MGAKSDYWVEESTPVSMADRAIHSPHEDGAVPDWLAAMPVAAAILHVFGANVTIQTCNAIFAERFKDKSQEWIGRKGDHEGSQQNIVRIAISSSNIKNFERLSDHHYVTEFQNYALER